MGIVKAEVMSIGEYLQNSKLKIPDYQRPYKWSVRNVIQLLDDILRFKSDNPYRIGTIVIHKENGHFNIVDGQQRTISFLLIVKSIYHNKLSEVKDKSLRDLLAIINKINFNPVFQHELTIKNIQENYREIERRIVNVNEDFIDFYFNKCEVTQFVIDDVSEAFQFFDSQNARGRDLEPHDLLKAFHLRELKTGKNVISEEETAQLVRTWEEMDTKKLSGLFADFLFRVRGWSKGNTSRYFSKNDTPLFKGINLNSTTSYPFTHIFKFADAYINTPLTKLNGQSFPFQLDQTIINGKYFFEMVNHYRKLYENFYKETTNLTERAKTIITTIDNYEGRNRTGDKYVRMMFNCALLYYVDKFGYAEISIAIEKIFIWAFSLRLIHQNVQMASIDNYVLEEINMFKIIRDAIRNEDILRLELPLRKEEYESEKTAQIKELFIKMKYYVKPQ